MSKEVYLIKLRTQNSMLNQDFVVVKELDLKEMANEKSVRDISGICDLKSNIVHAAIGDCYALPYTSLLDIQKIS